MNASVTLKGIQATASNLPLPDVSTWFAWYYQRNIDYSAGSLVSSGETVATTYIQDVSIAGNAYFEIESQEITASNLPLPDDSTWHDWYYERNLDYQADSLVVCSHIVATTYIQEVSTTGDAYSTVKSTQISTEFDSIFGNGDAKYEIDSVNLLSEFGEVTASAITHVSAEVSIDGILLEINQGNVSASALNEEIIQLSGNPKRYAANEFKYAKVEIAGISTKISTGAVKAIGSISISARANVQSVGIKSEVPTIYAEGVKWITEDELMTLLAA